MPRSTTTTSRAFHQARAAAGIDTWPFLETVITPLVVFVPFIVRTACDVVVRGRTGGDREVSPNPAVRFAMPHDVTAVRAQFPALKEGAAHFDGPGGSQVPAQVGEAVAATLTSAIANQGPLTAASRHAAEVVVAGRAAMGDLLGVDPGGVVFGRSMTQLTYDLARTLAGSWGPGDEVVVTRLDHDANIRPWVQAAASVGATIRWVDFDPRSGDLDVEQVAQMLSSRTRLVAVTGASNLIGTRPDLTRIAAEVHRGAARFFVDGVHLTPHAPVDVPALGADFYACSPYKFLGPHCGVMAADPALWATLTPGKLLPSSDAVPDRFELGTLPYELLAGTTAAVDFLASMTPGPARTRREQVLASMSALEAYEEDLCAQLAGRLADVGATVLAHPRSRTPTLLFEVPGSGPAALAEWLAEAGVNAPAGSFYALEASRHLGRGDRGGVRAGLAPYTDQEDVDRLVAGVEAFVRAN
jgi:cysteine desulfurase family protein (TIGR01976 family)